MLKGLCEQHHLGIHDLLRAQPMHAGNVDLLKDVIHTIVNMCEPQSAVQNLSQHEVKLVYAMLNFIVETMQVIPNECRSSTSLGDVDVGPVSREPAQDLSKRRGRRSQEHPLDLFR